MSRPYSRVRSGPISGRLVCQQIKFHRPTIYRDIKIEILEPDDWLTRHRRRLCRRGAAAIRDQYKRVTAIHFNKPKRKGAFIGDWGFGLMMKRLRKRKRIEL